MPRSARVVVPGAPHHVTQRGTRRFIVYNDEADRLFYMELLRETCPVFGLQILAYCLMTNHVHYVAIPQGADSIYRVFHRVHGLYAQHFNTKYQLVGHLWQDRPFSCVLDGPHVLNAIRYVERNPVRAHMVARAEDYRWSSAVAHCGLREDALLAPKVHDWPENEDWSVWLAATSELALDHVLRLCTSTGRPCGDDSFVDAVAQSTGRNFDRQKPGPKPRSRDQETQTLEWSKERDTSRL